MITLPCSQNSQLRLNWRPNQEEYANHIVEAIQSQQKLLVSGPCGIGKSIGYLAAAVHSNKSTLIVTKTHEHLNQLKATIKEYFPSVALLRGHAWYHENLGAEVSIADDGQVEELDECPAGCGYEAAMAAAKASRVVLTTTRNHTFRVQKGKQLLYTNEHGDDEPRQVLIVDECHGLRSEIRASLSSEFNMMKLLGSDAHFSPPEPNRKENDWIYSHPKGNWSDYLHDDVFEEYHQAVRTAFATVNKIYIKECALKDLDPDDFEQVRIAGKKDETFRKLTRRRNSLKRGVKKTAPNDDFVRCIDRVSLTFKIVPVEINPTTFYYPTTVLTSATPDISLPHTAVKTIAPIFKSPTHVYRSTGHQRSSKEYLDRVAFEVKSHYDVRREPVVLVLCQSNSDMEHIMKDVKNKPNVYLIKSASRDSEELAKARKDPKALIAVNIALWEGLDLPGNKTVIISKEPFPPPGPDTQPEQLLHKTSVPWSRKCAEYWAYKNCILEQGKGRAHRTETDRCTIILFQ